MPIFDYKCPACRNQEEVMVKSSEDIINCSSCSQQMKKMICAPNFILKGLGFFSSGSFVNAKKGTKIPNSIKEMPDIELNRSLGLPDDHQ